MPNLGWPSGFRTSRCRELAPAAVEGGGVASTESTREGVTYVRADFPEDFSRASYAASCRAAYGRRAQNQSSLGPASYDCQRVAPKSAHSATLNDRPVLPQASNGILGRR